MDDGVVLSKNTTTNGRVLLTAPCGFMSQYHLVILYRGFILLNESIRFGYIHSFIPLKKSLDVRQDDWTLTLMDQWELPLEINVAPQLTSKGMETSEVIIAESQTKNIYHFNNLVSEVYKLKIQYKSFLVEKEIQIPSTDETLFFPAVYPITFQVFNSRGMKIGNTAIQLSRGGKTINLIGNVSGTVVSIPPGSYVVSVLSDNQIISQRSLKVVSERSVDLFTTQEPMFPLLVLVLAGFIVLIGFVMSFMKKDPFYFLVIFVLGLCISSIVSPWWMLQGSSADVQRGCEGVLPRGVEGRPQEFPRRQVLQATQALAGLIGRTPSMARLPWLLLGAALALTACTRAEHDAAATALPTRQTTIDPVYMKLDAAAQDTERRRQDLDNAAK